MYLAVYKPIDGVRYSLKIMIKQYFLIIIMRFYLYMKLGNRRQLYISPQHEKSMYSS